MHARDIMTRSVVSVLPTAGVAQAAGTLTYRGFTALPVVDETGALIGIVTEADIIRHRFPIDLPADQNPAAPARSAAHVGQVMTSPAISVSHDADVTVAARVMLAGHYRCLPIVDGTMLVGVVTRSDILRALTRTDAEIAADIRTHLQVLGGHARWTVQVSDGEAVIRDGFHEASDRAVAQVLAEAVRGVISASITGPP